MGTTKGCATVQVTESFVPPLPPLTRRRDEEIGQWLERKAHAAEFLAERERRGAYLEGARREVAEAEAERLRLIEELGPAQVAQRAAVVRCPKCEALVFFKKLKKHLQRRCVNRDSASTGRVSAAPRVTAAVPSSRRCSQCDSPAIFGDSVCWMHSR